MAPRLAVLTPPGTGAIAVLALRGDAAWPLIRARFRPASGKPLPDQPAVGHWFGTLGEGAGDEVVVVCVATGPECRVEVGCHGGPRVVRWLERQLVAAGAEAESGWESLATDSPAPPLHFGEGAGGVRLLTSPPPAPLSVSERGEPALDPRAAAPLAAAPTGRVADILLDQLHGAFRDASRRLAADPQPAALEALARLAPLGRHLVAPWRVAVAGAPNAGKSTLVNAMVGYRRSVVSDEAGTTRDVVRTPAAVDGWPVELLDTAGLRDAADALEAAGVGLARGAVGAADLVIWVADVSNRDAQMPPPGVDAILVANKCDRPAAWDRPDALHVCASRGEGVDAPLREVSRRLVPEPPADGAAVPFTPELAGWVEDAARALASGDAATASELLTRCAGGR